jgi:hypothetical protein
VASGYFSAAAASILYLPDTSHQLMLLAEVPNAADEANGQKKRQPKGMPLSIPKHLKKLFFHVDANKNCTKRFLG